MTSPLVLPTDSPEIRRELDELTNLGYRLTRPSRYHLKIGSINYYPGKGTIVIDPCHRQPDRGFDALLRVLEARKVPRATKETVLRLV